MNRYHYTIEFKAALIFRDGKLLPSPVPAESREKPLLWFSTHPVYEPTAIKPLMGPDGSIFWPKIGEYAEMFTLYRFVLTDPNHPGMMKWRTACRVARMPNKLAKSLERAGKEQGAHPKQWWAQMEPLDVTSPHVHVEVLNRETFDWERWNEDVHGWPQPAPDNIRQMSYTNMKELAR